MIPVALIIIVIVFLILLYVSLFRRHRKTRRKGINAVEAFHNTYLSQNKSQTPPTESPKHHNNYITKYNSTEDYVTRE